jgi:dienelactone hydrolase
MERYNRTVAEVWELWKPRARLGIYPFEHTTYADNEQALAGLTSLDRDAWAAAYSALAGPHEDAAREAEARGDRGAAQEEYLHAYALYHMARFPTTNSPGKLAAYRKARENYLKAARFFEIPMQRVEIPFVGRPGEGSAVVGYLRCPQGAGPWPILIQWGGIDGYKEEMTAAAEMFVRAGVATLAMDGPGVGESPLRGSEDAERLWDAVFGWAAVRPDLDARRLAAWGNSTGGYWAAKLAHTHRERIAAAVAHGGCAHYAFTPEWIEQAQHGEYAFEEAETLAYAFGKQSFEEWVDYAPRLSLLAQGILDRPCAPLLLVNGIHDSTFPIRDMYLLLEHGSPKSARFYDAGHMGITPDTHPMILRWVKERLA